MGIADCLMITLFSAIVCICLPKMLMVMSSTVRRIRSYLFSFPQKINPIQPRAIRHKNVSQLG